jgi:hypothetical protein
MKVRSARENPDAFGKKRRFDESHAAGLEFILAFRTQARAAISQAKSL